MTKSLEVPEFNSAVNRMMLLGESCLVNLPFNLHPAFRLCSTHKLPYAGNFCLISIFQKLHFGSLVMLPLSPERLVLEVCGFFISF